MYINSYINISARCFIPTDVTSTCTDEICVVHHKYQCNGSVEFSK